MPFLSVLGRALRLFVFRGFVVSWFRGFVVSCFRVCFFPPAAGPLPQRELTLTPRRIPSPRLGVAARATAHLLFIAEGGKGRRWAQHERRDRDAEREADREHGGQR